MSSMPLISLDYIDGLGIIILYPSGVRYSNQVGGYATIFPEVEGVYVPLVDSMVDQEELLRAHFTGPKWSGQCYNGIDGEDADEIDRILGLPFQTRIMKVERSRLADSCEAWVYVEIAAQPDEAYPFFGFGQCAGVLTWNNSD
jgi:hypothetical protein